jgi:hypothetical protein
MQPTTVGRRSAVALSTTLVVAFLCAAASPAARGEDAPAGQPKVGPFTTTFTERSPLSEPKALAARLSQRKPAPDYDLSKEQFVVYVPEDYAPTKPLGILYLLNYKDAAEPPTPVLPLFKKHGLIYAMSTSAGQPVAAKCGMGLDVVHNLKKQYAVDPTRVYVFDFDTAGWGDKGGTAGQWLALGSADVFTGSYHHALFMIWRPVREANGAVWPVKAAPPPAASLGLAKTHPVVLSKPGSDDYHNMGAKYVQQQGFRHLKLTAVTTEQAHYPNFTSDWLEETLAFLDANAPKPPPAKPAAAATKAAAPATRTSPAAPAVPAKPANPSRTPGK